MPNPIYKNRPLRVSEMWELTVHSRWHMQRDVIGTTFDPKD